MMQSRLGHVQEAMVEALPGLQPAAGKWRLRCIAKLVEHLPYDAAYMQLIGAIMGEVILGTKSAARKTREVSFAVLVTMAQKVDAGSGGQQLGDLFTMLLAGLAGTTAQMVSATVYSLSRLVYEYADRVGQLAPPLLESVMLLFQHKSREIVTAALGFAKVAVVCLSPELLRRYMKAFISNLLLWSGDTRNRFRLKVKVVLERLMRRTSYEEVLEATPEEHRKLIAAVYKRWKRSKTLKARAKGEGPDAAEGDEAEDGDGTRLRLKGGYEAALYGDEDSEEEADDMDGDAEMAGGHTGGAAGRRGLDGGRHSGAAAAGTAARAGSAGAGPPTKFGFPATSGPDGKPVILEEAEESGVGRKRRRQEEDAQEVMAVRHAQEKEKREEEAVRQTGLIHSDSVALAEGAESAAAARGQRSWDQAPQGKKRRKTQAESKVMGGTEYQHKVAGAGGDIKKAGRPDPFAYVPFDKRQINKKKSHQPVKSLKKVFNGTRDARMGASQKAGGRQTRKKKK
jgi:ribosomal RNA-processing protein 12